MKCTCSDSRETWNIGADKIWNIREIFDEVESSLVMEKLWETYQKNYSYAADISWHIVMESVRYLYQTGCSSNS